MDKSDIARTLEEIADLLELKGESGFKIRAYRSGARALETLEDDLAELVESERLTEVRGIGAALADKISELWREGRLAFHEELKASLPPGLPLLLEIPGLGPKKARAVYEKLGVDSIDALADACRNSKVSELSGFGKKTEEKILSGIANREAYSKRHLWQTAWEAAEPILRGLRGLEQTERAEIAGSLRRGMETVGDLDFIVASSDPLPIMDWFAARPNIAEVSAKGETKSSVRLEGGLQADLRVVPLDRFYFALHHFTGSKDHNVQMRQRALSRGLSLSEWGLSAKNDEAEEAASAEGAKPTEADSEQALFAALGLSCIPPELREGLGEIEAAEKSALPKLADPGDIRGAFHNHTTASDGRATLEEMAEAADAMGWEYLGIADHSKASFQANGLDAGRLLKQAGEIRKLSQSGRFKARLLAGIECDILADGSLDLDDETLSQLDYVVASAHSALGQSEEDMTRRLIRALEHPETDMLGHLTGRLLLRREPSRANVAKVIDAAIANHKVIELNANPQRLDMDWRHWRRAAAKGALCAINPDAHSVEGLRHVSNGVRIARKGWLEKDHILNTQPLEVVLKRFGAQ